MEGVAAPNIKLYYYASLLVACIDCWRLSENGIDMALQQESCFSLLMDWMVQDKPLKRDLRDATSLVKLLGKIWLRYKKRFLKHLEFRYALESQSFSLWRQAGYFYF